LSCATEGQEPFDRILVTTGLKTAPEGLLDQLAKGGKLVAVIEDELTVFDKKIKRVSKKSVFPMSLPLIEAGKSKAL